MSRILGRELLELAARDPSGILRRPLSKRTSPASVKAGTSSKPMASLRRSRGRGLKWPIWLEQRTAVEYFNAKLPQVEYDPLSKNARYKSASANLSSNGNVGDGAAYGGGGPEAGSVRVERPCQTAQQLKTPDILRRRGFDLIGQRPTLPPTRAGSTIGVAGLNYRVRDGNGWDPCATITQK